MIDVYRNFNTIAARLEFSCYCIEIDCRRSSQNTITIILFADGQTHKHTDGRMDKIWSGHGGSGQTDDDLDAELNLIINPFSNGKFYTLPN